MVVGVLAGRSHRRRYLGVEGGACACLFVWVEVGGLLLLSILPDERCGLAPQIYRSSAFIALLSRVFSNGLFSISWE